MYGVVLWKSRENGNAVVWCEDHGNLAFYQGDAEPTLDELEVEVGDLIRFDIVRSGRTRLIMNPELVNARQFTSLPAALTETVMPKSRRKEPVADMFELANLGLGAA